MSNARQIIIYTCPVCKVDLERKTSKTNGRDYYSCNNDRRGRKRGGKHYFRWADDIVRDYDKDSFCVSDDDAIYEDASAGGTSGGGDDEEEYDDEEEEEDESSISMTASE